MQAVIRVTTRQLMPAVKPPFIQRANIVIGPPKYPMSATTKFVYGTVMFFGIMAVPAYLAANITNYSGEVEEH